MVCNIEGTGYFVTSQIIPQRDRVGFCIIGKLSIFHVTLFPLKKHAGYPSELEFIGRHGIATLYDITIMRDFFTQFFINFKTV